jgi:hypothetical protein
LLNRRWRSQTVCVTQSTETTLPWSTHHSRSPCSYRHRVLGLSAEVYNVSPALESLMRVSPALESLMRVSPALESLMRFPWDVTRAERHCVACPLHTRAYQGHTVTSPVVVGSSAAVVGQQPEPSGQVRDAGELGSISRWHVMYPGFSNGTSRRGCALGELGYPSGDEAGQGGAQRHCTHGLHMGCEEGWEAGAACLCMPSTARAGHSTTGQGGGGVQEL